jgi:hypothetical protein
VAEHNPHDERAQARAAAAREANGKSARRDGADLNDDQPGSSALQPGAFAFQPGASAQQPGSYAPHNTTNTKVQNTKNTDGYLVFSGVPDTTADEVASAAK